MEEDEFGNVNFIPCLCFVPRGIAKAHPEKITLTQEELARIISNTRSELANVERRENGEDEMDTEDSDNENETELPTTSNNRAPGGEAPLNFDFENYDNDATGPDLALNDIVDLNERFDDEEDSEAEDDLIKSTDNLILVGRVQDDCSSMEVYVYNEEEGSLYVHHDFLLPAFPLCIEWLSHDPGNTQDGNMCAIGSMDPIITIWDLDIQDSLEPTFKLGKKGKKKSYGHTDAVLDLSWNKNFGHILASGSVDQKVILWDLDSGDPHTQITAFKDKVQTISFQPVEAQSLLAGSCDGIVKLFDCRDVETINTSFQKWKLDSEIERVCWNPHDLNYFMASTNSGYVHLIDIRHKKLPIWSHQCHEQETTGLVINNKVENMLTTTSADGLLKVWDFNSTEVKLVYTQALKIGRVQCCNAAPENPFTIAVGGDFQKKHFKVVELNHEVIVQRFGNSSRSRNDEQMN